MKLLTITEAADVLRLSRRTLFRMARIGRIQFVRLGPRSNRIKESELNRLIEKSQ